MGKRKKNQSKSFLYCCPGRYNMFRQNDEQKSFYLYLADHTVHTKKLIAIDIFHLQTARFPMDALQTLEKK